MSALAVQRKAILPILLKALQHFAVACLVTTAAGGLAWSGTLSFTGTFVQDDDMWSYTFSVPSPALVVAMTTSFATGGFAPILSVFQATGDQLLLARDSNGGAGSCGPRVVDPASGFCWDAYLSLPLDAGDYLFVLTEDDNQPLGPSFTDGFLRAGQGNFTGPAFTGEPGSFILEDGSQRSPNWAVEIATIPEPATVLLLGVGLLTLGAYRRERQRVPDSDV